jgi:hypothetical protein
MADMPIFSTFCIFFEQMEQILCEPCYSLTIPCSGNAWGEKERDVQMATTHRDSAKIYQFPVGGRANFALKDRKFPAEPKPVNVCDTDNWYHQAAMLESEKEPRKP